MYTYIFQYESGREKTPQCPLTPQHQCAARRCEVHPVLASSAGSHQCCEFREQRNTWPHVGPQCKAHLAARSAPRSHVAVRRRSQRAIYAAQHGVCWWHATSRDVCTRWQVERDRNQHANLAGTRHVATRWPTWECSSCIECIACQEGHVTICIALHRIALCLSFASRRTTFAHVGEFVQDRNHIAILAGTQHVGTRWRTCDLP